MAIIKKTDILEPGINDAFKDLFRVYNDLDNLNKKLIDSANELQATYKNIAKTNDGKEAKQLIAINNELIKSNQNLEKVEQERVKTAILLEKKQSEIEKKSQEIQKTNQQIIKTQKDKLNLEKQQQIQADKTAKTIAEQNSAYKQQSALLTKLRNEYKDLAVQNKENTKEAKALLNQVRALDQQLKKVDATVGQHQRNVGNYGDALKGLGAQLIGAFGIVSAIDLFANAMRNAFNTIREFGSKVSELKAITGLAGEDLEKLKGRAIDLGAEYGRSASEIVEAMKLVGSAKPELLTNVDALDQMTQAVLTLSQASGMDLASSAQSVAIIMNQMNKSASQANDVINVLAAGAKFGSVEIDYLAQAMTKVGTTAQSAGLTLEQTVAALELFGEKGIQAETAGTGLKKVLLVLQKDTKNYTNGVFDLNKAIDNNQKISTNNIALQKKFGDEFFNLGGILLQNKERFLQLNQQVTGTQTAFEQAADAMNNLNGDLQKASGTWDKLILSIESGNGIISKGIRGVVQSFTEFIDSLAILNDETETSEKRQKSFITVLTGFSPVLGAIQKGIEKLKTGFKELFDLQDKAPAALGDKGQQEFKQKILDQMKKENDAKIEALKNTKELSKATQELSKKESDRLKKIQKKQLETYIEQQRAGKEYYDFIKQQEDELLVIQKNTDSEEVKSDEGAKQAEWDAAVDYYDKLEKLRQSDKEKEEKKYKDFKKNPAITGALETIALLNQINETYRREDLDAEAKYQESKKMLIDQAIYDSIGIMTSAYNMHLDQKLENTKNEIEAEKQLLQDKLDKGLISEEEYKRKIAALNKKQNLEEAKTQKKKALYEIAINTAIAIVKALPNWINVALVAAAGAIQAASVAAQPLPKFAKGEVNIKGKKHSEGGIQAEIEGGESVINRLGTANAPETLKMINSGLLRDSDLIQPKKHNPAIGLLSKLNQTNEKMLTAISNGVYQYTINGITHVIFADGSKKIVGYGG